MAIPLTNYKTMDPFILLSAVNMLLRDDELTLDELCAREELDKELLCSKLQDAGFKYDETTRQFK